jgi:hypothetical protein
VEGQTGRQRETDARRDVLRLGIPGRGRSDELGLEQEAIANLAQESDDHDEGDGEPEQSHRARLADLPAPVEHLGVAAARMVWILLAQ